jgi:signal peptidase I
LANNKLARKTQSVLKEMWQEAYERGERLSFAIVSSSMSPMIEVGDVVVIDRLDHSRVRIGDVVAFNKDQYVVVHRIIGKSWANQQLSYHQRGDASISSGKIAAQDLIGRVSVVKKEGRAICLGSRRHIISNRIFAWRLLVLDNLVRIQPSRLGVVLHQALRTPWKMCRSLLFWRL